MRAPLLDQQTAAALRVARAVREAPSAGAGAEIIQETIDGIARHLAARCGANICTQTIYALLEVYPREQPHPGDMTR